MKNQNRRKLNIIIKKTAAHFILGRSTMVNGSYETFAEYKMGDLTISPSDIAEQAIGIWYQRFGYRSEWAKKRTDPRGFEHEALVRASILNWMDEHVSSRRLDVRFNEFGRLTEISFGYAK